MKAGDAAQVAQTAQAAQAASGGAASTKVLTDTGAAVVTFATEEHAVAVAPTWVEPSPAERKYAEESAANLFNICHKGIAPEIAKFRELLSTGVDIRHKGRSGWTALIGASRYGHTAVVRELITADGSVEHIRMQDDIGYTALINAAAHGHADAVRELVATDGLAEHIRLQNNNGWNALISAARYGHTSIVRVLVAVDGSVEHLRTQDNNGATALIHAAYNGHTEIVKEIVTADGSLDLLNIKNKLGETALDWAIEEDNDECTVLLREAGAQGGSLYPEGRSERATLFVC